MRVASLYLPNGNPVRSSSEAVAQTKTDTDAEDSDAFNPKYTYKLDWMAALEAHAKTLLSYEEAFVLAGDYNVIPTPADTHDPVAWDGDALFRPKPMPPTAGF